MLNRRFTRLVVTSENFKIEGKTGYYCSVKCDCGNKLICRTTNLYTHNTKSCGCLRTEILKDPEPKKTHGKSRHPIYWIHRAMLRRCYSPNDHAFPNYGGRGVKVCQQWHNIKTFIKWAEENKWEKGLQIDRIDNDKSYSPSNCRIVTPSENCRNTSTNKMVTIKEDTKPLCEWCEILNRNYKTVANRIHRMKWEADRAVLTPTKKQYVGTK